MIKRCLLLIALCSSFFASTVDVEGWLSREKVHTLRETLLSEGSPYYSATLDSPGGDFFEVLSFCREMKEKGKPFSLLVKGNALGAAALLPFVATELSIEKKGVWGNLPFESELPKETIWKGVKTLIQGIENELLLSRVAEAMIDPYSQIVGVSSKRPLILSSNDVKELGIGNEVAGSGEFYAANGRDVDAPLLHEGFVAALQDHIHFSNDSTVGYLSIGKESAISQSTYLYVKFALESFVKENVSCVILHLDTPGGEVFSALKIAALLQEMDIAHKIPVIAYVDTWAVSAGALLAYSCRFIVSGETAIMGAAEPVVSGGDGQMQTASEKVNSALRAEFASAASFWGRNADIAEAMVDKDCILVLRQGKIVRLQSKEEIVSSGSAPDIIISQAGKLLTLTAKEMFSYGVSGALLPRSETLGKEVILKNGQAEASSSAVFALPYLKEHVQETTLLGYSDWKVSFFTFLSHPMVASLLFFGMIVGFYIEFNTPGFGIFGSIGLFCLGLIILSGVASYAITFLEMIFLGLGLILLLIELFVIPGFGITGISGILLLIIGLITLSLPNVGSLDLTRLDSLAIAAGVLSERLLWIVGGLLLGILTVIVVSRFVSTRLLSRSKLILKGEQFRSSGFPLLSEREEIPDIGALGHTVTSLRPSGKVRIGKDIYEAVSYSGFIEEGAPIELARIDGDRLVVKALDKEP